MKYSSPSLLKDVRWVAVTEHHSGGWGHTCVATDLVYVTFAVHGQKQFKPVELKLRDVLLMTASPTSCVCSGRQCSQIEMDSAGRDHRQLCHSQRHCLESGLNHSKILGTWCFGIATHERNIQRCWLVESIRISVVSILPELR